MHPLESSHTCLRPLIFWHRPLQANRSELEALKTERKSVLEREKDAHELANYLVSLQVMEQEQSGLEALAAGWAAPR